MGDGRRVTEECLQAIENFANALLRVYLYSKPSI